MSGRGILIVVAGVIVITSMIMFNIEAASTRIVKNYSDYYIRQHTQNVAQSGVNLAITQLGRDREWRAGFTNRALLDGIVDVDVFRTTFDSIPAIAVRSVGQIDYSGSEKRRDTSIAYLYWSKKQYPINIRGLLTLNGNSAVNGNITIDGRDHDLNGNLIAGSGIPAVFSTASSFTLVSAAAKLGGTDAATDFVPSNPYDPAIVKLNQVWPGGYPQTPDSVFGGEGNTFPEGTLKAIAEARDNGSQYVTDPSQLHYPLRGVTYVEMPTTAGMNVWSSAAIGGSGILVVHNAAGNALLKNTSQTFKGLIIADDVMHLHGDVLGGLIAFKNALSGNVIGNGNARILYSREAIVEASKFLEVNGTPSIIAWWE